MNNELRTEHYATLAKEIRKEFPLNNGLSDRSLAALDDFNSRGLPKQKAEDWKFTPLAKLLPENPQWNSSIENPDSSNSSFWSLGSNEQLIIGNGILLEIPESLRSIISLNQENEKLNSDYWNSQTLDNLNAATFKQLISVNIPANWQGSLIFCHVNSGDGYDASRLQIELGKNAQLKIMEVFIGSEGGYQKHHSTCFNLEEGARVDHVKVNDQPLSSFHMANIFARLDRNSHYSNFAYTIGSGASRSNIVTHLDGEGAEVDIHGLYLLDQQQHVDNASWIIHHKPRTYSRQFYGGLLDGESRGIFSGTVQVDKIAQQVESEQLNKNILLSKSAHADTRPQLFVNADDVKCTHGATVGQLGDEEKFYLESRGLKEDRVKQMLCHGFAHQALQNIPWKEARELLSTHLDTILKGRGI